MNTNPESENPTPGTDAGDAVPPVGEAQAAPAEEDAPTSGEDALRAELAQLKDQLLRTLADAENTRRRAAKEREDATKFAVTSFARDLLDFADNVNRAIESIPQEMKDQGDDRIRNLIAGLSAMEQQMLRTFEKHGITKLMPHNENFDPNFHEVIFEAPGTGKAAGTIIQIVEPGYVLNGRLLRPARVGVAKGDGNGSKIDTQA